MSDATAFHRHACYKSEARSFFGMTRLYATTNHRSELPRSKCWRHSGSKFRFVENRRCCGRPAFSQGNLDAAAKVGKDNVDLLSSLHNASPARTSNTPILFLEPSCWSMFVEDYRELRIENAEKIANRCFLFEKFVDDLLAGDPQALPFQKSSA